MRNKKLTLKWKFILTFVSALIAISLLQSVVFYRSDIQNLQDSLQRKMTLLASMIADNTTSSLQFRAGDDARAVLSTLANEPMVEGAYLFTGEGLLLAEYVPDGNALSVPLINNFSESLVLENDKIIIQKPIVLDKDVIGLIYLSANLTELIERRNELIAFSLLVVSLAAVLSVIIAMVSERIFITPISYLSNLSRRIGQQRRYDLRATKTSEDEIGHLVDNFNGMLDVIEKRDNELQRKTAELSASNAELEQFAYITSHDLKTPLVTISGYSGRLRDYLKYQDYDKLEKSVARIQRAVARMGSLIEDVLTFSRIGRQDIERRFVDLNSVVNQIASDLKGTVTDCQARIVIETLPRVTATENEVRQVFQNLLANALYHACKEPQRIITVGYVKHGGEHRVFVSDNGPGIPERYQQKVFQLFYRLDVSGEGSGLGLAIVQKVMSQLSGQVWIESEEGKGTTFWLAFPNN